MRFRLQLEYDGSDFWGWQVQPGRRTVQGTLEQALGELLGEAIRVTGAGRTDRGVHATAQVAHFDSRHAPPVEGFARALAGRLPPDLRLRRLRRCAATFHARYGARWRRYVYLVARRPSVFRRRYAWVIGTPLELAALERAAAALAGAHDFRAFAVRAGQASNGVCRVRRARWDAEPGGLRFLIEADRFLTRMVRLLVGAMVASGGGRLPPAAIAGALAAASSAPSGWAAGGARPAAAPAAGLYLAGVGYGEAGWERAAPGGARPAGDRQD